MIYSAYKSPISDKEIFILTEKVSGAVHYGIVTRYERPQRPPHYCGYLNIGKGDWLRIGHLIRSPFAITFEAIESQIINVPKELEMTMPVLLYQYWVGIDYADKAQQPTPYEVAERLLEILYAIQQALANA